MFDNLAIWQEEKYRALQGKYPVISLSFANVKDTTYQNARRKICQLITELFTNCAFLFDSNVLAEGDRIFF